MVQSKVDSVNYISLFSPKIGLFVFHFLRVKSGILTEALFSRIDFSDNGHMTLKLAAS